MLFQKGDAANGFYLVVYGQVKLAFPSLSGNEKVVDVIGPSQSFGEAVMLAQRPYPVFAQAIIDTLLIHVTKDVVFDLLENDPSFARRMLIGLAMHNHSLVHDIESYTLRSSAQRVIGYLLQHCPSDGNCEGRVDIILPTSKQITASRLNLTPETLSRILHDLAEAGLIEMQGKHISINNPQRLRVTLAATHLDESHSDTSRPRAPKRAQAVAPAKTRANIRCAKTRASIAELRA
jgi:CRP-like cAMP-binding protein